jgi:ribose/xylose/arabinose/galactoside ABC-type transport system permease subunit
MSMPELAIESVEKNKIDKRSQRLSAGTEVLIKLGVYLIVVLFLIVGTLISDKFLSVANLMNVIDAVALLGIVSTGVAFVTYSAHYADMSAPVIMAFSGLIAVEMIRFGLFLSILSGIGAGLLIGLVNAFVIGKLKANPIIWTLAVSFLFGGFVRWIYGGTQIYPDIKADGATSGAQFVALSRTMLFGRIPLMVIVMIVVMLAGHFLLNRTGFGQQLKIVGSNRNVAKMSGINVSRTVGLAFMLSALTASIGGIFLASLTKIGAYYNGEGYDFNSVTAIVLGGMSLAGGRGSIGGVLGGVLSLGLLSNLMTLMGVDTFSQKIVKGIIFILVVGLNARSLRKAGRDDA